MAKASRIRILAPVLITLLAGCEHGELIIEGPINDGVEYDVYDDGAANVDAVDDTSGDTSPTSPSCAVNNGGCAVLAWCEDIPGGSVQCACKQGFVGNGYVCDDIDECAEDPFACEAPLTCFNTPGGYLCDCPEGPLMGGNGCRHVIQMEAGGQDWLQDMAVDKDGNTLVLMTTWGHQDFEIPYGGDIAVVKFDRNGNRLWTNRVGSRAPTMPDAIDVDFEGNAYVVGAEFYESSKPDYFDRTKMFITRIDRDGKSNWTTYFIKDEQDEAVDVALSGEGVYVAARTGFTGQAGSAYHAMILKLDFDGKMLWNRELATARYDIASSIAVDRTGAIYVAGETDGDLAGKAGNSKRDIFLARFDADGNGKWIRQLDLPGVERQSDTFTDSNGNIYLTGSTTSNLGPRVNPNSSTDVLAAAFNPDGDVIWVSQFDSGWDRGGRSLTVDGDTLWISGRVDGNLTDHPEISRQCDAIFGLDISDGSFLTVKEMAQTSIDGTPIVKSAADGTLRTAVLTTRDQTGGSHQGDADVAIFSLDGPHDVDWTRQVGLDSSTMASGIEFDTEGRAFVVGTTLGNIDGVTLEIFGFNTYLVGLRADGTVSWTQQQLSGSLFAPPSLAIAGDHLITAATTSKYDPEVGVEVMDQVVLTVFGKTGRKISEAFLGSPLADQATDIVAGPGGNLFVSGLTSGDIGGVSSGRSDAFVAKLDSNLSMDWARQIGSSKNDQFRAVTPYPDGGVIAVGRAGGTISGIAGADAHAGALVVRYDAVGNVVWTRVTTNDAADIASGVTVDSQGDIFVTGSTNHLLADKFAGKLDIFVMRIDGTDGKVVWTRQFGTTEDDEGRNIRISRDGDLLVTGIAGGSLESSHPATPARGGREGVLIRLSKKGTGERSWLVSTDKDDSVEDIAFGPDGKALLVGWTKGNLDGKSPYGVTSMFIMDE